MSILARRPHKDTCPRKPARPEEKTKVVGLLGVKPPKQRVRDSSPRRMAGQSALRLGSRAVGRRYEVKNKNTEQGK